MRTDVYWTLVLHGSESERPPPKWSHRTNRKWRITWPAARRRNPNRN